MKRVIIFTLIISLGSAIHAKSPGSDTIPQTKDKDTLVHRNIFNSLQKDSSGWGSIHITQDGFIKTLIRRHIKLNSEQEGIPGYRIRIFSINPNLVKNARSQAIKEKEAFDEKYPGIPSYLKYESLRYKVYVGDFRTRLAVEQCLQRIKSDYPNAFGVKDRIKYSP